ncbi:MAG TPA: hypothetical protein VF773_18735 [Verrucomicrobiae bacterium]
MLDFFYQNLRPVNLPFTALLGMVTVYWLLVLLGALDFDSEPSVDLHSHDVDVNGAAGAHDVDHGGVHGVGAIKSLLQFLNFGNVPSTIVLSVLVVSMWAISLILNRMFNPFPGSVLIALGLLVPNLIVAALITKAATTPLKHLFNAMNKEREEHQPVLGRTCTILTSEVTDRFGQAEIQTSGAPLVINVRTYGEATFAKGESALIIKEDKENNLYTVAKLTSTTPQQETTVC